MPASDPRPRGLRPALRLLAVLGLVAASAVRAYPPAPPHTIYGLVRDAYGTPYQSTSIAVVLLGGDGLEKARTLIDPLSGAGTNYSLEVAMDAGHTATPYIPTAMRPTLPFTMRVVIGGVSYLPIQLSTGTWTMGLPAQSRRIDLTVGVDSDGDGLPDAWETELIYSDPLERFASLTDVRPGDDADGDGLSNLDEYIAGTYAFDAADGLALEIVEIVGGYARLRFLAITGRTYSLTASTDLAAWGAQPFALSAAPATSTSYVASDVRVVDVYVPMGAGPRKFFRLHVQ